MFPQRTPADEALLRLAALRFAQSGMPAEVYAQDPAQLEHVLSHLPEHDQRPVVHLHRGLDLLAADGEEAVATFADRFAGRVAGLVVHDQVSMSARLPAGVAVLRRLAADAPPGRPRILLEYAAGLGPDWHLELAERLADTPGAACCVDIGHVAVPAARAALAGMVGAGTDGAGTDRAGAGRVGAVRVGAVRAETGARGWPAPGHPRLPALDDPGLAEVVEEVEAATRAGRRAVLDLVAGIGDRGGRLHLHLHDGHPLHRGLADHFSFLARIAVPFEAGAGRELSPLFGPAGLAQVLRRAERSCRPGEVTATLEVHQVEGRQPLPPQDIAALFGSWRDLQQAERMNHWLSVLADNHALAGFAQGGPPAG